jgi:hypothetical protein
MMIGTPPAEPVSLTETRERVAASERKVLAQQSTVDRIGETLVRMQQPQPWWRRAIGFITGGNTRHIVDIQAASKAKDEAQAALVKARKDQSDAAKRLSLMIHLHKDSVREHTEKWTPLATGADARIAAVKSAQELWKRLPGAAALGANALYGLGCKLSNRKRARRLTPRGSGEQPQSSQP